MTLFQASKWSTVTAIDTLTIFVSQIRVCSTFQKLHGTLFMAPVSCTVQRCISKLIRTVNIRRTGSVELTNKEIKCKNLVSKMLSPNPRKVLQQRQENSWPPCTLTIHVASCSLPQSTLPPHLCPQMPGNPSPASGSPTPPTTNNTYYASILPWAPEIKISLRSACSFQPCNSHSCRQNQPSVEQIIFRKNQNHKCSMYKWQSSTESAILPYCLRSFI